MRGPFSILGLALGGCAPHRLFAVWCAGMGKRRCCVWVQPGDLKQKYKNLNHLTLPELRDFNGLDDTTCFTLFAFRYRYFLKGEAMGVVYIKEAAPPVWM